MSINVTIQIGQLDSKGLAKDLKSAAARSVREIAEKVRSRHRDFLNRGETPEGGSQKENSENTRRAKQGKPPLVDTGRLRDATRSQKHRAGGLHGWRVQPPSDRRRALDILHRQGYETVFQKAYPDVDKDTAERVQANVEKINVKRRIKNRRIKS